MFYLLLKLLLLSLLVTEIKNLYSFYVGNKRYFVESKSNEKKHIKNFIKYQEKLRYAGISSYKEIKAFIYIKYFVPVLLFIGIYIINNKDIRYSFIFLILYYLVLKLILDAKTKSRNKAIEFYGYKIFKFLLNQISSGIIINDAIKSIYMVVNDEKLRTCLINVSAYYTQTNNIKDALKIFTDEYKGVEVDTLYIAITQGIYTGDNFETMKRMEALLFKRYIYHIKTETDNKRHQSFLAVLLFCIVIIMIVSVPILMDIFEAFDQILL